MLKLIIPMYSMRSHTTGKYSILKDGNFKLHINRMNRDKDHLVIPHNCEDLKEFLDLDLLRDEQIFVCEYGSNTVDTRRNFWTMNSRRISLMYTRKFEIVTDITGYKGRNKFYNNFNITKLPNLDRPYIDEFFDSDIISIRRAEKTFVLNQAQKDYILETNPDIPETKIEVNQRVISDDYFAAVGTSDFDLKFTNKDVFFPFRLSDKAYCFDQVLEDFSDYNIYVTDPNDTLQTDAKNVIKIRPNKKEYYGLLAQRPKIPYYENPNEVFHPGLADFIYFGCDIICPYKLPTIGDVMI